LIRQLIDLRRVIRRIVRQHFRFDFLRLGIHRKMQLTPSATLTPTILSHLPFAFAINFQASAVNDKTDCTLDLGSIQRNGKCLSTFCNRREIRNDDLDLHQSHQSFRKAFGRAIGQPIQLSKSEKRFDCQITVCERATDFEGIIFTVPLLDNLIGNPEREVATIDKGLIVFRPIDDLVLLF